ncbi:amidohydrolase family protein [Wenzhouxiangella sp. EGI_FJ10409]|uniref:amidohydrolase family protein n=1 Tax=Wenzhouxiangella sp. EGI_FJ10409 TaxID=3243767 RepID=UPI0035DA9EED
MKSFAGIIAILLAAFATLLLLPGPVDGHRGMTAITNVRLFDGEQVIENATLLIADGRIAQAGRNVPVPEAAAVVDGTGKTILPGLIDAHVHAYGSARNDALRMGVTTLLDMFRAPTDQSLVIQQRESLQPTDQADLFSAGYLATAEGGHGTQYGLSVPIPESPQAADDWVRQRLEEGSDYIKIIIEDGSGWGRPLPTLDAEMVRALVEAAHARGVLAVAHASTQSSARMAVEAGVDGLVHLFADEPVDDAFIASALDAGIWIVPTTPVPAASHGQAVPDWLTEGEFAHTRISAQQRSMLNQGFPGSAMRRARWPVVLDNIAKLHEAGVPLLAGSDAGNPGTAHGPSLHHELALLVGGGLTPLEALHSATRRPARAFGLEDRGCLKPGCRADLVLVDGNPFEDIRHTVHIHSVWKNGFRVDEQLSEDE